MNPSAAPVTVLVVEDDADHRFLVQRRLESAGIDVRTAGGAEEALEALDGVDVVLLDHQLPGASGLEVLPLIRERGPSVVMLTGMGSEDLAVEAMRQGALDYVVKGGSYLDVLPQVVERALRHHDLERRAGELERIGLLVTSATARIEMFTEIVAGARRLLRADGCALFVLTDGDLVLEAAAGELQGQGDSLLAEARLMLSTPEAAAEPRFGDRLLVPLPTSQGRPLGVLVVLASRPRTFVPEELQLARSLAAYAGIALANVRRLDLERTLVGELQEMLDLRRELMATVSHELRTPITCVSGFADTLLTHWEALADDDRRMFVEKMARHAGDLGDLVDRLLDFSQMELGWAATGIATLDLGAEVRATVGELAPLFEDRPVEIELPSTAVVADPVLLRRTLTNLVSNAVKYSERGTPIAIRVGADDSGARLEVVDQGVGLSQEEAARVFDPFWRGDHAHSAGVRGAGIGLALVKEYVRIMGGQVAVESEPGRGSTFVVRLPVPERAPSAAR
jgi:phosphoserine phosphatase RsbU/P